MSLEENETGFYELDGNDNNDRVFYGEDEEGRFIRYQARLYFEDRRDLKIHEDGKVKFETNDSVLRLLVKDTQQLSMNRESAEKLVEKYHDKEVNQLEQDLERFYEWVTEVEEKTRKRHLG